MVAFFSGNHQVIDANGSPLFQYATGKDDTPCFRSCGENYKSI